MAAGFLSEWGVICSSVVRAYVESILHVGHIELFLVPAIAPRLVQQRPWCVLLCLWDNSHIKESLMLIEKRTHVLVVAGFLSE